MNEIFKDLISEENETTIIFDKDKIFTYDSIEKIKKRIVNDKQRKDFLESCIYFTTSIFYDSIEITFSKDEKILDIDIEFDSEINNHIGMAISEWYFLGGRKRKNCSDLIKSLPVRVFSYPEVYNNIIKKCKIQNYISKKLNERPSYEKHMPQQHKAAFMNILKSNKEEFETMLNNNIIKFAKILGAIFFETPTKKIRINGEPLFSWYRDSDNYTGFNAIYSVYTYENYQTKYDIIMYLFKENNTIIEDVDDIISKAYKEKPLPKNHSTRTNKNLRILQNLSKKHFKDYLPLEESISFLIQKNIITDNLFLKKGETFENFKTSLKQFVNEHNKQTCPICGKEFIKDRKDKTTCGSAYCKNVKSRMKSRIVEFVKKKEICLDNINKSEFYEIMKEINRRRIATSKRQHKKYKRIKNLNELSNIIYEELKRYNKSD